MTFLGPIVINLDSRPDRWREVTAELEKVGLTPTRLSATPGGAVGCLDSHSRALELFLKSDKDVVLIMKDDAVFQCDKQAFDKHANEFLNSPTAMVACLGYNARLSTPFSSLYNRSREIQTRVCYFVRRQIAKELLAIWREIQTLVLNQTKAKWYEDLFYSLPISNPPKDIYRGDQSWKVLQQEHIFLIPKERLVIQRPSFSDIENIAVNYKV